jgi:hypothetical protein
VKKLDEKLSLLRMAKAFGVDPDPKLLEEIDYLRKKEAQREQQQTKLKERVRAANPLIEYTRPSTYPDGKPIPAALPPLYQSADNKGVPAGQNCQNCEYMQENGGCSKWKGAQVRANYWCAKWEKIKKKDLKEEVLFVAEPKPQTAAAQVADFITRNPVKEATLVNPEPNLLDATANLPLKFKQLEKWVSKIAATGPGSGAAWLWDLGDVSTATRNATDTQILAFDGVLNKWMNKDHVSSGVYILPYATTSVLGGVKIDGTSIISTAGVISATYSYTLPTATTSVLGGVKIDNTSITINNGVISATQLQTDNTSITVSGGVISAQAYYGSFYSTQNLTSLTTSAQTLKINNVDVNSNGVNLNTSTGVFTLVHPGTYNVAFSMQVKNTDTGSGDHDVNVWLRQNGTDVPLTNSIITVPAGHGSAQGYVIAAWNLFVKTTAANETFELRWWTDGPTMVSIETVPAQAATAVTPAIPSSPAVILTVNSIKLT